MLGSTMRDRVTGFTGVVTGRVEYITGCTQLLLTPPVDTDGKLPDAVWFDRQRLSVDASKPPVVFDNVATPGFDKPAPTR